MGNLETLEKNAREGLKGLADKANWAGVNATVSREFITKTAGEFTDAHTEASTIRNILKDTHEELVSYHEQLNEAISRGLKKNLTVMDTGNGSFTVTMNIHPDRAARGTTVPDHSEQDVTELRDDVQRILGRATHSDETASEALRAIVEQAEYGFSGASYGDRDSATKALEDAEKYANLIKNKGDSMSPQEFDELNRNLMRLQERPALPGEVRHHPRPEGDVGFLGRPLRSLGRRRSAAGAPRSARRIPEESQSHSRRSDTVGFPAMRHWEDDMVQLGDDRIQTRGTQVYGFQLMSNLMRVGDYNDSFLNKYGDALVSTEKKMKLPDHYWNGGVGGPAMPKMNFMGDEFGRDPMTGFMTALSNSPDAATDFFNRTDPQDNAEWVLKDRPTFDDTPEQQRWKPVA